VCDFSNHEEHVPGGARPDHADRVLLARLGRADKVLTLVFDDENPSIIKRPILQNDNFILAGFKADEWKDTLN